MTLRKSSKVIILRIIVPIKQVPETSNVKMDPTTGTMIRAGSEAIINPLDLYALEASLGLKDKLNANVSLLSMGPLKAKEALKEAIALGCDDAVLLSDKAFRGADTWATSYTLSQAIRKMGRFQFIICGERATDGETGQVGPGIAALLDLPIVTFVRRIFDVEFNSARFERLIEGGVEIVRSELPVVITVVKEIGNPRLPTLRGMKIAKEKHIPVWGPEEINANPNWIGLSGSPTRVIEIRSPHISRNGKVITAKTYEEMERGADQLLLYLKNNNLLF